MVPVSQPSRRLSSGVRPRWPAVLLVLPFVASILGAYAWFNTDLGRPQPRDQKSEARSQNSALTSGFRPPASEQSLRPPSSGIWLTARTNIPGYTFVEDLVARLGFTNVHRFIRGVRARLGLD